MKRFEIFDILILVRKRVDNEGWEHDAIVIGGPDMPPEEGLERRDWERSHLNTLRSVTGRMWSHHSSFSCFAHEPCIWVPVSICGVNHTKVTWQGGRDL